MKSARVAAYWYATAIVLVASALMRAISRPHVFPWWFVGAEFGAGIAFGVLAWWLGRGAVVPRLLALVAGVVVVLGAAALLVTGLGYEFGAVPAALGVIVTATAGELTGRSRQVTVSAVGDWSPLPATQASGPQPFGPQPVQPPGPGPQARPPWPGQDGGYGGPMPPQHDTRPPWPQAPPTRQPPAAVPPQHATQPQWSERRPPAPPQRPSVPPQHPTLPPQHGTYPPAGPAPYQGPPPRQSPPPRGAPGDPPWRRVPGPSVPALPDEPPAPARPPAQQPPQQPPPPPGDDADLRRRARHAAEAVPDAEPGPPVGPEVQWAPRRRRHARPEQTEGASDPSHQEPEEN